MDDILFIRLQELTELESQKVSWLLTNHNGKFRGVSTEPEDIKNIVETHRERSSLVLIIPDSVVSYHVTNLPIKDSKKRQQAVAFALEDKIISDIEATHFSIGPKLTGDKYLVTVINKQLITSLISDFEQHFNIIPQQVFTDGMCLYEYGSAFDNDWQVYLNADEETVILCSEKIIVSDLQNIDSTIENIGNEINCNFYRFNLPNIGDYLVNSINKVNIKSDQQISKWLPFIVDALFRNKNRKKFNLVKGLVKSKNVNIKFDPLWKKVGAVWLLLISLFISYKYFDNTWFSKKNNEINLVIKKELAGVEISTNNISLAEKAIDKKIKSIKSAITKESDKDEFYLLLSKFSSFYTSSISVSKILFQDSKLELILSVPKGRRNILTKIQNKLKQDDTILFKNTIINDDKEINTEWQLSFKK